LIDETKQGKLQTRINTWIANEKPLQFIFTGKPIKITDRHKFQNDIAEENREHSKMKEFYRLKIKNANKKPEK
jgi:hypothetical protein